jgi:hypothetical protein
MNKFIYSIIVTVLLVLTFSNVQAGNPDRQGEAGAPELLMNPWARSSGLHTMTTSMITGVEAMRLNIAGLSRINKTEIVLAHTIYLKGTDVNINALGLAQKLGKNSALGISLMSLDFGDIPVTTTEQPEGTGSTFSPRFFNLGLGYSHMFENKVSVGVLFRVVSQSLDDVTASALAVDAGVQYVTGENDNFKFGISLRNVGTRMQFKGEGLAEEISIPSFDNVHGVTVNQRPTNTELQSVLNIGLSYDFLLQEGMHRLTLLGNYTSNAFSEDNIGGGVEYSFRELVMLRGGYKLDYGKIADDGARESLFRGLAAGVTLNVPVSKKEDAPRIAIDYAYLDTKIFSGNHHISVRISL